ncbi:MAG: zf-HC2 domain-containing protein [Actinomycetota bacterium]|nr:zf-HC2 domain-containing protein [Actinomycetota bacterium]
MWGIAVRRLIDQLRKRRPTPMSVETLQHFDEIVTFEDSLLDNGTHSELGPALRELDAPRPSRPERLLRRLGTPSHVARLAVATPSLRRAWFVAIGLVVFVGLAAADPADPRDDLFALLILAPLVPLLGVAMSFGPEADPAHEVTLSTPMRGIELVLTRTVTVLITSLGALGVASILAPGRSVAAFGWVIPALGLRAAVLAGMTLVSPRRSAAGTAIVWVVVVTIVRRNAVDPLAAFTSVGQLVMLGVLPVGAATAYLRRNRYDLLQVSW